MLASFSIAQNFTSPVRLRLNVSESITTFSKRDNFGIGKESKIAFSEWVLRNQNIKDIESNLMEEVSHNLINKWGSLIGWKKGFTAGRKDN